MLDNKNYRKLEVAEIALLKERGCTAADWNNIEVTDGFLAANVQGVRFGGMVKIGANNGTVTGTDGISRSAGMRNAEIVDCTVGDNVFISNIGGCVSSCDVGDGAYIENVGKLVCTGTRRFGNGVRVAAVNEGGGREIPIHDGLTAQTAYILAMYRHREGMIRNFMRIIDEYCNSIDPARGTIGKGARITGCGAIENVRIGDFAVVEGASVLANGTIDSSAESPAYVGYGVKARDFIVARGAQINNGAALNRCFAGEACRIDSGYTATDSLFFANCECVAGEACSVFAGPYTVSHHKSSLLIAGYFLFFNAGSGANQSNHLFKTGAVHQGVHERGCKFASNAYVMLPAREGSFTVVLGRHTSHHDTADFPYSYLVEEDGRSFLLPGMNIKSYGVLRDFGKWPRRDRRGTVRRDLINFDENNPYVGMRILNALEHSRTLLSMENIDIHTHNRLRIKTVMLRRGVQLYRLALDATIGEILSTGFGRKVAADRHWVDMAGMYAPKSAVDDLLERIETGELTLLRSIEDELRTLHDCYRDHAYAWALSLLGELCGREPSEDDIAQAIENGRQSAGTILAMRTADAEQDAGEVMTAGYGIDAASPEETAADFKAVRKI